VRAPRERSCVSRAPHLCRARQRTGREKGQSRCRTSLMTAASLFRLGLGPGWEGRVVDRPGCRGRLGPGEPLAEREALKPCLYAATRCRLRTLSRSRSRFFAPDRPPCLHNREKAHGHAPHSNRRARRANVFARYSAGLPGGGGAVSPWPAGLFASRSSGVPHPARPGGGAVPGHQGDELVGRRQGRSPPWGHISAQCPLSANLKPWPR